MSQQAKKKKPLGDSGWHYFLKLESDFFETARYLGASTANDTACSIEFAQQIVCINTECEGIIKRICKAVDPKQPAANMGHYKRTLLKQFPKIHAAAVKIRQFNRTLKPFAGWNVAGGRLDWWNAYQDTKYHRDHNFEKANLINTLEALCALLVLEMYLYALHSPEGAQSLEGTRLLWTPGMPRTDRGSDPEFLPHLPLPQPNRDS